MLRNAARVIAFMAVTIPLPVAVAVLVDQIASVQQTTAAPASKSSPCAAH